MQLRQNFCLMLPALGRAKLSEQQRQLQVVAARVLPGEALLHPITDPPTHPFRAEVPFLLFILMNPTPNSLLPDKNSDNLLTTSRQVPAPLVLRFACPRAGNPAIQSLPSLHSRAY